MELNLNNLTLSKEKTYFTVALVISIIAWVFMAITIVGLFYAVVFSVFIWLSTGLFIANLKADCVLINEQQLPKLHQTFQDVCRKMGVTKIPRLYVLQSGGLLNAFAIRHAGRDFVVIYSDALEAYGEESDEIRFLLGHELGHIKSSHIVKHMLLFPGLILPLLGPAYHRACEASCDRYGAFAVNNVDGAVRSMMVLSGGRDAGKGMNPESFSAQHKSERGFFVSWYELISGYPTLSQRVTNLLAIKHAQPHPSPSRNPFSYLFAMFSFGGPGGGGGNAIITIAIIAMLAAIAIPNLLRAKISANEANAQMTLQKLADSTPEERDSICDQVIGGYMYSCETSGDTYKITAVPQEPGTTGFKKFTISPNGFTEEEYTETSSAQEYSEDGGHYSRTSQQQTYKSSSVQHSESK